MIFSIENSRKVFGDLVPGERFRTKQHGDTLLMKVAPYGGPYNAVEFQEGKMHSFTNDQPIVDERRGLIAISKVPLLSLVVREAELLQVVGRSVGHVVCNILVGNEPSTVELKETDCVLLAKELVVKV